MPLTPNARGILVMCAAMAAFVFNDTLMKAVTQDLPLMQAIAIRGVLATAFLVVFATVTGGLRWLPPGPDRGLLALRTLAEVGATVAFLAALVHMPLANLSAIMQALPLAVTLAAALVFGERIGWRRMTAIGVGFAGVLLIVRPGTEGFDGWSVVGLVSVAFVVVRDLATRGFSAALPTATAALAASVAVTAVGIGGVVLAGRWVPVPPVDALRLAGAATALFAGYLLVVKAMRMGDLGLVAPFRYTAFLWALVLGWLFFGDLPDALSALGAALILGSGLFAAWRERQLMLGGPVDIRRAAEGQGAARANPGPGQGGT
jgi:drug/metabolite transporter (DMT)-like permease